MHRLRFSPENFGSRTCICKSVCLIFFIYSFIFHSSTNTRENKNQFCTLIPEIKKKTRSHYENDQFGEQRSIQLLIQLLCLFSFLHAVFSLSLFYTQKVLSTFFLSPPFFLLIPFLPPSSTDRLLHKAVYTCGLSTSLPPTHSLANFNLSFTLTCYSVFLTNVTSHLRVTKFWLLGSVLQSLLLLTGLLPAYSFSLLHL